MALDLRFFALHYLNDWFTDDRRFVAGLSPASDPAARLAALCEAATYYKVMRTLPTLEGEDRLAAALSAIDGVPIPITDETVDAAVCGLATRFQQLYGRYAISAASKFLWVRHRWPVVILDDRASQYLWAHGGDFSGGDYPTFRREWRRQFAEHEDALATACAELVGVKPFTLANEMPDGELESLTLTTWFRERVFDKMLWWYAGK